MDELSHVGKRFYFLKFICDDCRIYLTYEDPTTEAGFREAVHDLEIVLQQKGIIRINKKTGRITVLKDRGGAYGHKRNTVRRKGRAYKKVSPVHG